jgi:hypothetical protein
LCQARPAAPEASSSLHQRHNVTVETANAPATSNNDAVGGQLLMVAGLLGWRRCAPTRTVVLVAVTAALSLGLRPVGERRATDTAMLLWESPTTSLPRAARSDQLRRRTDELVEPRARRTASTEREPSLLAMRHSQQ